MIARTLLFSSLFLSFAFAPRLTYAAPIKPKPFVPATLFDKRELNARRLPNGVRALVLSTRGVKDGTTGVVTVQVWVRAGSRYETGDTAGAAGVLEEACLRASQSYPARPGDDESAATAGGARGALLGLGAQVGSQTSRDAVFFTATLAPGFYPSALRALSDAVLRPRLSDADIKIARDRAEGEVEGRSGDPIALASDTAYDAAFSKHPYKRPAGGSTPALAKLTAKFARDYHAARFTGNNICVIVAGDVDAGQAHALIAREFASAAKGASAVQVSPESAPLNAKTVTVRRPLRAATVAIAWRAPGIGAPDDVLAMDVLLSHWKEGSEAALRRPLLGRDPDPNASDDEAAQPDDNALALAYDVDFLTQRDPGLTIVTFIAPLSTREAAARAVLNEVTSVQKNGLTPVQLARAKSALRRQYLEQSETPSGAAGALGFYEMIADYTFAQTYLQRASNVTSDDVRRIASKYLSSSKYVQVIIEPQTPLSPTPEPPEGTITASYKP